MFPITITRELTGKNGVNWPGLVILDPSADMRAAVWAQEAWESAHKSNPVNVARVLFSAVHRRRMEVMGHEVEVQAAVLVYGADEAVARAHEARSMQRGYGGLFDRMSQEQIEASMIAKSLTAWWWVRKHRNEIERWK